MRLSVCMCVYNGEAFIEEQIVSIAEQLESCDELIIVSDASVDQTVAKIKSIGISASLTIIENVINSGPCKSFEQAIRLSKGEFVFLSDQDDVWCSGRVREYLKAFKPGIDVVAGNAQLIDKKSKTILENYYQGYPISANIIKNIIKPNYVGALIAFRRDILMYMLPFPRTVYMHDMWIGIYCVLTKRVCFLEDTLTLYRRHPGTFTKVKNPLLRKIQWRLKFLMSICVLYFRMKVNRL